MRCPVCASDAKDISHPRFKILFHVCETCGLIVKDPSHRLSPRDEKAVYDLHQNSIDDAGYVNFLTNFMEAAVIPYAKGRHLLDFGSGPVPVFAEILTREGFDVSIYDPFYAPDTSVLESAYDVITTVEVVEHLSDPLGTFRTLSSMLRPGGILAVMTLFHPDDMDKMFDWFYIRDTSHVAFYLPETLKMIATMTGLEVVRCDNHRQTTFRKVSPEV
jgi:SAM-dependent methyltransferase